MVGIRILIHSIKMVLGNFADAIRIFGILYIPIALIEFLPEIEEGAGFGATLTHILVVGVPSVLLVMVLLIWMAVAWHRFILLGERPASFLPRFRRNRFLAYTYRSVVLFLIELAIMVVGMGLVAAAFVTAGLPHQFMISGAFGVVVVALVVFYRLAGVLPAASLGSDLSIGQSWRATRGATWPILLIVVLSTGATFALDTATLLLADIPPLLCAGSTVVGWAASVVSLTVITTIYGHFVEGRPVD